MALFERTLFGDRDKVAIAIQRIREFEPPDGYYLAFSGGKDSQVIYHLAKMAGVKFDAHYNVTTVDPPELLRFIREHYPDVLWDRPQKSMYRLIVDRGFPPTRRARYCCRELKESGGEGRTVMTGIRWEESVNRSTRGMFERCMRGVSKLYLHPIIDWLEEDVWEFHRMLGLPHVSLYDGGMTRVGCIMCPLKYYKARLKDAERWPSFAAMYLRACNAAFERRKARGDVMEWTSGEEMYNWWLSLESREMEKDEDSFYGTLFS